MSKKDIIDYVMETPGNTNKKVLGRLIDEVEGVKLPEVTEDDNGSVLTVVEGAWDKAEPSGDGSGGVKWLGVLPELFSGIDEQAEDPEDIASVLIPNQTLDGDIIDSLFDSENPYLFLKMVLPEVFETTWVFVLHDIYASGSVMYTYTDAFAPIWVSKNVYSDDDITFAVTFKNASGGQKAKVWGYDSETNKYVFNEP